jgi:superfamily II DNA helicase RecQ
VGREERRKAEESFKHDKEVEILIATDAAGEGINLQRAHLMVNYDLPWNPNRLEQRFGRIHRIGQTEVCHLWNVVAKDTREGEVYHRLLEKLDEQRKALGGQVFDVLGQLTFEDRPLRELLLEAIRYGDKAEVKARLFQVVDQGEGSDEYKHPTEFFRRTFLTEGLRRLLSQSVLRLSGKGGDPVVELQTKYGPCLILIDEWVAYARQLHTTADLPAGSFETHFTFAQALSEAAKAAKNTLLVVSIAASSSCRATFPWTTRSCSSS